MNQKFQALRYIPQRNLCISAPGHMYKNVHVLCLVAQLRSTLCDPMDCSPPGSSVHRDSPGKNTGVGCHALFQGIFPNQGLNSSPALQVNSLLSEPPGKPKNVHNVHI